MKKEYIIICAFVDGKHYMRFTSLSASFSDACKTAKLFSKHSGLTVVGVIEQKILSDNS